MISLATLQETAALSPSAQAFFQKKAQGDFAALVRTGEILRSECRFLAASTFFEAAFEINSLSCDILLAKIKARILGGAVVAKEDFDTLRALSWDYHRYAEAFDLAQRTNASPAEILAVLGSAFEAFSTGSEVDWLFLQQFRALPTDAAERSTPSKNNIPHSIFMYWDKDPPSEISENIQYHRNISGFDVNIYDKNRGEAFLYQYYGNDVRRLFLRSKHPAEESDFLRYHLIYAYGGYYIDVDDQMICAQRIVDLSNDTEGIYILSETGPVENAMFGSIARSSIMEECIRILAYNCLMYPDLSVWLKTGPGVLTRALVRNFYRAASSNSPKPNVTVLDPTFYAKLLRAIDVSYRNDLRDWRVFEASQK